MALLFRLHCSEDRLVALLDGELTLPERAAVQRHLGGCPRCAGLLARHEACRAALHAALAATAERVDAADLPLDSHLNVRVAATGAGVLAGSVGALVVAGLLVQRHRRPRRLAAMDAVA